MSKKAKYNLVKVIVALCLVFCAVLTVFELGVTYRTIKAAEVDGTEYSVAEYNWLYTNSVYEIYNSYYNAYGDYAVYFFNPSSNLSEQVYNTETGETWADYVKDYTDSSVIELTRLYNEGKAAGFELAEEYYEFCDDEWAAMEETAKANGYTANSYAELSYGRGVNEKVFKDMFIRYYYAIEYSREVSAGFEVSAEEIDAYYAENKVNFDTIAYNYYFANGSASEGEDAAAKMEEAKAQAEAVLSGAEEVEFSKVEYGLYASTNELYADWVFDSARTVGDKEVFETENGYYVVEFVGANEIHYNTVDVRHILVSPEDSTDEALAAAREKANTYFDEFVANGSTEEAFAELAEEYSTDANSNTNGGLYENVYKGQMADEFEAWAFDPARKAGDCEIIESSYGYHVMYFSGVAEDYYTVILDNAIRNDRLNAYLDSIIEGVEISELSGMKYVGKHYA